MTRPSLADMPPMDDHKVGPGGQTFGELKQAVRDAWSDFLASLVTGKDCDAKLDAHDAAVAMLKAAYTRVGLPYVAP